MANKKVKMLFGGTMGMQISFTSGNTLVRGEKYWHAFGPRGQHEVLRFDGSVAANRAVAKAFASRWMRGAYATRAV